MKSIMWRTGLIFTTCFLALAGCKKEETATQTTTTTKEVTTSTTSDAPVTEVGETVDAAWQMKPGKWSSKTTTTVNGQKMTLPENTFCNATGQAFSQSVVASNNAGNADNCQMTETRPDANTLAIKTNCNGTQSDITITRIDDNHYKQLIKAEVNGTATETEIDMTYLGECDDSTPTVQ